MRAAAASWLQISADKDVEGESCTYTNGEGGVHLASRSERALGHGGHLAALAAVDGSGRAVPADGDVEDSAGLRSRETGLGRAGKAQRHAGQHGCGSETDSESGEKICLGAGRLYFAGLFC